MIKKKMEDYKCIIPDKNSLMEKNRKIFVLAYNNGDFEQNDKDCWSSFIFNTQEGIVSSEIVHILLAFDLGETEKDGKTQSLTCYEVLRGGHIL